MIKSDCGRVDFKGMWIEMLTDTINIIDFVRKEIKQDNPAFLETFDDTVVKHSEKGGNTNE